MLRRNESVVLMKKLIDLISSDKENGITRFLQANPYSGFEYYNFDILEDQWEFFEEAFYCESELSRIKKEQICNTIANPNGKNTFFIVGYQGCGKSTFIHSVINKYNQNDNAKVVVIDCDKFGEHQVKQGVCAVLTDIVNKDSSKYDNFVDFYKQNEDIIDELNNNKLRLFYTLIDKCNKESVSYKKQQIKKEIKYFIEQSVNIKDAIYIIMFWNLARDYHSEQKSKEKIMLFFDNLDCVDNYSELKEFISTIDSFTVEMSSRFKKINLCGNPQQHESFVSKIKIFIAMRETTRANLPTSHFSDVFRSIYTNMDITEWYDKGRIIEKRIHSLLKNDYDSKIDNIQREQFQLILNITEEIYTKKVIYPLFNNNYRSAVEMISRIITSNTEQIKLYTKLIGLKDSKYRHGARGVLLKYIFDELNTGDSSEENCFKRIGVLDLLNRNSRKVSICRLILSYLSHYTETKCDSGRNSVSLREIINAFKGLFKEDEIIKVLCEMFLLRDTVWTHLVSFNQMEYQDIYRTIKNTIDFKSLDFDRTTLHYSCAGKIYIEYVATHFEFFNTRIFAKQRQPLFSSDNFAKENGEYRCCEIIDKVYDEIERCCTSLKKFNTAICNSKNYLNPYEKPYLYWHSHYICTFKRKPYDGEERRFKQFHEERLILTHINYIDSYRLYVLNHCDELSLEEKIELNEKITERISKYVQLLISDMVLKNPNTYEKLGKHYISQIAILQNDWSDFKIEISKNNSDDLDSNIEFRS